MTLATIVKAYLKPAGLLRIVPFLLIIPIIVFHALSLTGCLSTSPAIPNIYIVSLRSNSTGTNGTETPVQARIGYFGICGIDTTGTRCEPATGKSATTLATNLFPALQNTTTSSSSSNTTRHATEVTTLLTTALDLQSRIFISVLAGGGVLFLLGLPALFLLHRDARSPARFDKPRRSVIIRRATYGLLAGSAALAFAAALATTQAASALEYAAAGVTSGKGEVVIKAGRTLQVMQWLAFGFEVVFVGAMPWVVGGRGGEEEGQPWKEQPYEG
ncbi:Ca2+ regulator and membrane fusion protein Fig1-domain-containing protein [Staphylotrichum tortipilum]|uniref:Ca2+ regulator and membrane fusion protein Fig1-domain-containing protein n=1 Tax=Staphylotrichum tortipilum TaxID=2831512 RepID=A0AAN6RTR2_9PEZI|nr:Ca2+ regulator and membrane fusion protein Fig1-domain-containing protein [Staphylotrichum longicolle]